MKVAMVLAVLVVAVAALPPAMNKFIPILEMSDIREPSGAYETRYLSGDGTLVKESGTLIPSNDGKDMTLIKMGDITYTLDDGTVVKTNYTADEKGYRVDGTHLPIETPSFL